MQGGPATEGRGWNAWNGRQTVAMAIWGGEAKRDCCRLKKLLIEMWILQVQTYESIHRGFWFVLV